MRRRLGFFLQPGTRFGGAFSWKGSRRGRGTNPAYATIQMPSGSRVSAIVTAYNGAAFVVDAIESILAQTRPVDEIVVGDDPSNDNTPEIVQSYQASGERGMRE